MALSYYDPNRIKRKKMTHTNDLTLKTADVDIICYKVVKKPKRLANLINSESPKISFKSQYKQYIYNLDETVSVPRFTLNHSDDEKRVLDLNTGEIHMVKTYKIEEGIHSYISLSDAIDELSAGWGNGSNIVVKCIIPKGSKYIIGYDNGYTHIPTYVSNSLKIVDCFEEINEKPAKVKTWMIEHRDSKK